MMDKITKRDWEKISAYLDGELSSREAARLEARLKTNPELRRGLKDLHQTRALLREQPELKAPRNFTLSPEMVSAKASPKDLFVGAFPVFRSLSLASAALFLLLTVYSFFMFNQTTAQLAAPMETEEAVAAYPLELAEATIEAEASQAPMALAPPLSTESETSAEESEFEGGAQKDIQETGATLLPTPTIYPPLTTPMETGSVFKGEQPARQELETLEGENTESGASQPMLLPRNIPWMMIIQVFLALVAVISGIFAILSRKRG